MPAQRDASQLGQRSVAPAEVVSIAVLGFLASSLVVAAGSLAGAAQPGRGALLWAVPNVPMEPSVSLILALIGYFGGLVILVRSWLLLRRCHLGNRDSSTLDSVPGTVGGGPDVASWLDERQKQHRVVTLRTVVLIAVVWALPMLIGPPLGSRDVYAYGAQGRLAEQGYDVYEVGPAALGPEDAILVPVDPLYRETPVLYGPAFVSLSSAVSKLTGSSPILAVVVYRLLAVAGLIAASFGIHSVAKSLNSDPIDALLLSITNPLVLLHLVSGAHNDAIMLGLCLLGVAAGVRMRLPHVAVVLCAVAAAIKLPAMLAVAFVAWPWVTGADGVVARARRLALVGIEAIAVMAVAGQLTGWGWSWVQALVDQEHVEAYLSITTLAGGGLSFLPGLDFNDVLPITRLVGVLSAAGFSSLLLLRRSGSWVTALAWSFLLWAVLHPTTQPWYFTWGMLVLAPAVAGQRNRFYIGGSVVGIFAVLPIGPQLGMLLLDTTPWPSFVAGLIALLFLTFSFAPRLSNQRRSDLDGSAVSILVPTRDEALNVGPFVSSLHDVLDRTSKFNERSVEILFIDDSEDDTPARIEVLADLHSDPLRLVRGDHRPVNQRWGGLSGAVVDGLSQAKGQVVVVMDGDLQHPASKVPELIAVIDQGVDLAVASRRMGKGSDVGGLTKLRYRLSVIATGIAQRLFPRSVGLVTDPLSGFFAVRVDRLDLSLLQPDGFKILIEVLATHPDLRVKEVPFTFGGRLQGISKASGSEGVRFLGHLFDLKVRHSRLWAGSRMPQKFYNGEIIESGRTAESGMLR